MAVSHTIEYCEKQEVNVTTGSSGPYPHEREQGYVSKEFDSGAWQCLGASIFPSRMLAGALARCVATAEYS